MAQDLVDRLIEEWRREKPALDTSGIALVGRIMQLGRLLENRLNAKLKPFGLTYTDFDLLATLRRSGGDYCLTPTQLRRSVLLTSGAMTAALDRLENMGLIERLRSEADRRSMSARLTPAGKSLLEDLLELRFDDAKQLTAALSKSQTDTAAAALRRMLMAFEEERARG